MTNAEAQEMIDVILDKHETGWFEPEEKDIYLNLALSEFVKDRYKEFEVNEKRREDIRTLIKENTGAGATINAPADMMFVISLKGTFVLTDCGTAKNVERFIKPSQHDDINKVQSDPFNKPENKFPLYLTTSTGFDVRSDTAPLDYTLTYIKTPVQFDGTNNPNGSIDLPDYTHEEIVNLAVRKILFILEKQTYNLQVNEIQNQE